MAVNAFCPFFIACAKVVFFLQTSAVLSNFNLIFLENNVYLTVMWKQGCLRSYFTKQRPCSCKS